VALLVWMHLVFCDCDKLDGFDKQDSLERYFEGGDWNDRAWGYITLRLLVVICLLFDPVVVPLMLASGLDSFVLFCFLLGILLAVFNRFIVKGSGGGQKSKELSAQGFTWLKRLTIIFSLVFTLTYVYTFLFYFWVV
jgi:hypothetical protein